MKGNWCKLKCTCIPVFTYKFAYKFNIAQFVTVVSKLSNAMYEYLLLVLQKSNKRLF